MNIINLSTDTIVVDQIAISPCQDPIFLITRDGVRCTGMHIDKKIYVKTVTHGIALLHAGYQNINIIDHGRLNYIR